MSEFKLKFEDEDQLIEHTFVGSITLDAALDQFKHFLQAVGYSINPLEILELTNSAELLEQFDHDHKPVGVYIPQEDGTSELTLHVQPSVTPADFRITDQDADKTVRLRNGEVLAIYMVKATNFRSSRPVMLSNGTSYPRNGRWYGLDKATTSDYDIIEFCERRI